ncbi:MAG TPA: Hpt domain-containing protein [Acidobacteriaceae bacterium]|nr:Hpt domain-containing protein [Acidobacteriaceae bacterium]
MTDAAAQLAAKLNELWRASRPLILERMAVLHATQTALAANLADTAARREAREAAHKLAGVLGTFGLPRGSELASALEKILMADTPLTADDLTTLTTHIAELESVIASKP